MSSLLNIPVMTPGQPARGSLLAGIAMAGLQRFLLYVLWVCVVLLPWVSFGIFILDSSDLSKVHFFR